MAKDDIDITAAAERLGKSRRWLEMRLASDARLQFHHYIGRSRRWDESEFQALRRAIIAVDTAERRTIGPQRAPEIITEAQSQEAVEMVRAFLRGKKKPRR